MAISRRILLRMRNVSDKIVQKIATHFLSPTRIPPSPYPPNIVPFMSWCTKIRHSLTEATDGSMAGRTRFACWITKTRTHIIFKTFLRALMLRYTYCTYRRLPAYPCMFTDSSDTYRGLPAYSCMFTGSSEDYEATIRSLNTAQHNIFFLSF